VNKQIREKKSNYLTRY